METPIKTIKEAKEVSLEKWAGIGKEIIQLRIISSEPCGFCNYTMFLDKDNMLICNECLIHDNCKKLGKECSDIFYQLITKIDNIISFIENVKEDD